jgi:uncharacterized protein
MANPDCNIMKYNLSQLLLNPTGSSQVYTVDQIEVIEDEIEINLGMKINMTRTHQGIWAQIDGNVAFSDTCSRCLEKFKYVSNIFCEEEYYSIYDVEVTSKASYGFIIDQDHMIDLSELVRQSAIVSTGIKALCKESCKGLCDECGSNLNVDSCDCVENRIDPRWSGLAELTKNKINI